VLYDVDSSPAAPVMPGLAWLERGFPLLAAAWFNAPSARAAVGAFLTYRPLLGESDWVGMREREGTMQIQYLAEGPQRFAAMQAAGNFGMLANLVRAYDQGAPTRFTARLTGAPSRCAHSLEALLGGPVICHQPDNLLEFSTANLDEPFPHHNPALRGMLEQRLAEDLADLAREASLALTVERALRRALAGRSGLPVHQVLERVCAELGTTRWTLRRRLAAEGLTFKEIHAQVKLREARRLLEQSSLSLSEVSDHLGFTAQSSFTRFFRQEVGVTPQHYRSQAGGGLTTGTG
jgi:AraC-like DNA-binding protein